MTTLACFTLGYSTFAGDEKFIKSLLAAAARGGITSVEKKYVDGNCVAKVGKVQNITVEHLELQTDSDLEANNG